MKSSLSLMDPLRTDIHHSENSFAFELAYIFLVNRTISGVVEKYLRFGENHFKRDEQRKKS